MSAPLGCNGSDPRLAYRIVFAVLVVAWIAVRAWYEGRYAFDRRRSTDRRAGKADFALVMASGILFAGPAVRWVLRGSPEGFSLSLEDLARVGGATVAAWGLVLFTWSHIALGDNWSRTLELRHGHRLVDRGPYRTLRHPMYSSILLLEFGLGILSADFLLLFVSPLPFLLLVCMRLPREEALMRERFADAWREYAARTRRLVPWIY